MAQTFPLLSAWLRFSPFTLLLILALQHMQFTPGRSVKKALHTFQLSTLALPACQIDKMQKETRTEVGVSAAFSGLMLRLVCGCLCVYECACMCMFVPVQFVQHLPVSASSLMLA